LRYARDGWAIESGQYEKNTGGLPKWYRDAPEAARGDDFYMSAFSELSSTRQFGDVIGPIPWNHIIEYGFHHGLDDCMMKVLVTVIREMDEAWLEWQRESARQRSVRPKGSKRKR
jgi:hypothetical protein